MLVKMDIEILKEKQNQFFKRKEVDALVRHSASATPSKADVSKWFAEKNSVDITQVVVDFLFTKKGQSETFARVKVLDEKPKPKEEKPAAPVENKTEEKKNEAQASQGQ
jgi:ribosomal protein S24E